MDGGPKYGLHVGLVQTVELGATAPQAVHVRRTLWADQHADVKIQFIAGMTVRHRSRFESCTHLRTQKAPVSKSARS